MTRSTARELAQYSASILRRPYCLCRSKEPPEVWTVLAEEAIVFWKTEWKLSEWEVVETFEPPEEAKD